MSKKLLIWGTGRLCYQVVRNLCEEDIIGYVDSFRSGTYAGKRLFLPDEISRGVVDYDAILVTTIYGEEIRQTCLREKIDISKLIFIVGNMSCQDLNENYGFISSILGEQYSRFIKNRYHLCREIEIDPNKTVTKDFDADSLKKHLFYRSDYVRLKTFELLVDEIKDGDIEGNVAELGVFTGDFAQLINMAFPNRKLYLFDTFEGFDSEELKRETEGELLRAMEDTFADTSVELVMEKMTYKENVIIKKGFFPDSLNGLEDVYAFVSLDCDWEESLYQGISYFYPRLAGGGYIMIHDYNNVLECAKKALRRYESDYHIRIPKVPVCDAQGSIILTK